MRLRHYGAMLFVAAVCLFATGTTPARAADWLGGPYWGRISGCTHCGQQMYGMTTAPNGCTACQAASMFGYYNTPSKTRIVHVVVPPVKCTADETESVVAKCKAVRRSKGGGDCGCSECSQCGDCSECGSCGGFGRGGRCGGKLGCRGCRGFGLGRGASYDDGGFFNCGCNGSYKFPVPPLYTYHWPGMYSMQLMTDYHSPWRFPPLRPYTDEPEGGYLGAIEEPRPITPASATEPVESERVVGEVEAMSDIMQRIYR